MIWQFCRFVAVWNVFFGHKCILQLIDWRQFVQGLTGVKWTIKWYSEGHICCASLRPYVYFCCLFLMVSMQIWFYYRFVSQWEKPYEGNLPSMNATKVTMRVILCGHGKSRTFTKKNPILEKNIIYIYNLSVHVIKQ